MIVQNYTEENWLSYMLLFTAVVLSRLTSDLDQAQRQQLRDCLAERKKRKKGEAWIHTRKTAVLTQFASLCFLMRPFGDKHFP